LRSIDHSEGAAAPADPDRVGSRGALPWWFTLVIYPGDLPEPTEKDARQAL